LTFDASSSDNTRIAIYWTQLTTDEETGGSPIVQYLVESAEDDGQYSWTEQQVSQATNTAQVTGLTGGTQYLFRVRANNLHGDGPESDTLSALAAQAPDQPAAPTTAQVTTSVQVIWTLPVENHQTITDVEVYIGDSTSSFASDLTLCDASAGTTAFDNQYCVIALASLIEAPYNLAVDDLIEFKVRAKNSRGWSAQSDANTAGVKA
jgi:hypothetical protein